MIDNMFEGRENELTLRLDQKLFPDHRGWCRVGPFEVTLTRGEAVELLFPDEASLYAVFDILQLRDLNWIGSLRVGNLDVTGADLVRDEMRPWPFSSPPIHDSSVTAALLTRFATRHGFADPRDDLSIRRIAAQFDLEGCLEVQVAHLSDVERQSLQCALLYMQRPHIVLIDGTLPLLPPVRQQASAVFSRLVGSSAIVILKLLGSNYWSGLATTRVHVPAQSIPHGWGYGWHQQQVRAM